MSALIVVLLDDQTVERSFGNWFHQDGTRLTNRWKEHQDALFLPEDALPTE